MTDDWGTDAGWGAATGSGDANNNSKSNDKGCRICKEEGHFARECPKKGEDRPKRGCFKCGEEGHSKADCPNEAKDGGGDKRGCFKCKGDHMASECELPDTCRKCKKEGHMAADCEEPDRCHKCKEEGHMAADCELPDKCYKCRKEGHMAADCEEPDKCRFCGEEGHKAGDCTGAKTHEVTKEDGTKHEIYIPSELTDDKLFEQGINQGINFDKFDNIKMKIGGENAPNPIAAFEKMGLRQIVLDNIKKSGYKKPTPIQKIAIPCIMGGRDLMGCAQTGSGKTAAFVVPMIHKILEDGCDSNGGDVPQKPQAVVIAPTRELAIQIKDEARKFSNESMCKANVVYGGTSSGFQITQMLRGTNILIATPGRLMDFVEKDKISFENLKFLVLDEADRMLDMGFRPEIVKMCEHSSMPSKENRQTLMFSATFPSEVQQLALDFLKDYLFLTIGILGSANNDVTQNFVEVEKFKKRETLIETLKDVGTDRTLVFVETKKNADFLACILSNEGFPTTSIHGDRLQREREEALRDFKTGKMPILVATAVAARGLDIKGVAHVVNYDLPKTIDEYVHRIGRTGRVGNTGKATSFFDPNENSDLAADLVKILSECQQEVPDYLANGGGGGGGMAAQGGFGGLDIRGGAAAEMNAAADDEW